MATIRAEKRRRDKRSLARIAKVVETFDFDPSKPIPSELVGWEIFKRRLLPAVNADAHASLDELRRALRYFRIRRSVDHRPEYNCWFVATLRLMSTAKREMGDTSSAQRLLHLSRKEAGRCSECLAEIDRSWALLYLSVRDAHRARAKIVKTTERYVDLGHDGHNLNDNAPASCLFAASYVSWLESDYDHAIEQICEVVDLLDPERSPELYTISQLAFA